MDVSIDGQLVPICSIDIAMKPMTLEGDLLALSDDHAQTTIYNWKTGDYAVLKHLQDQEGVWKVCLSFSNITQCTYLRSRLQAARSLYTSYLCA